MRAAATEAQVNLDVSIHVIDLQKTSELDESLNGIFECVSPVAHFDWKILVNNAGTLGHLGPAVEMNSLQELQQCVDASVTSSIWISSRFCRRFARPKNQEPNSRAGNGGQHPRPPLVSSASLSENDVAMDGAPLHPQPQQMQPQQHCTVVNMTSLCAINPFKTMAVYSATRASREMFHLVLSQEEADRSNARVLNYAPGACQTDMNTQLRQAPRLDKVTQDFFQRSFDEKTLIQPADTSRRLVQFVLQDTFESGKHYDYWDLVSESMENL
jgi:sepiapterin reductase